jgi:hypothetical protein
LPHMKWTGCDLSPGPDVDFVGKTMDFLTTDRGPFDLCIACEAFEHDRMFWVTNDLLRMYLKPGGFYVVTTPANGFPYHAYPRDYYRFQKDTYEDVFFAGYEILAFDKVGPYNNGTNCGIARKPLK